MADLNLLSAKMIDLRDEERKMKSRGGKIVIIAVAFSALLIMSSGAQASGPDASGQRGGHSLPGKVG